MSNNQARIFIIIGVVLIVWFLASHQRTLNSATKIETAARHQTTEKQLERTHFYGAAILPPAVFPADDLKNRMLNLIGLVQSSMERNGVAFVGDDGMAKLQAFVDGLNPDEVRDAAKVLEEFLNSNRSVAGENLQMRLLNRWTENNPADALAWAIQNLSGDTRQKLLDNMAGIWAAQNLSDAMTWAQQLPSGDEHQSIVESMAHEAVYLDPLKAIDLASSLPDNSKRDSLIAQATGAWAREAPDKAVEWARQMPEGDLKDQVVSAIAMSWGENNPIEASTFAIESLPPGEVQNAAVSAVVVRWAMLDRNAAQAWVEQFPASDLREKLLESLKDISDRMKMQAQLESAATE